MNPKIFFDLDGPILDVSEKYYRVYHDIVTEWGGQPIPKSDYWDSKRQRLLDWVILQRSGLLRGKTEEADGEGVESYRRLRQARIETPAYLVYDKVWPGIIQMLQALASQTSVVLVTLRHSPEMLNWELNYLGLLPHFGLVLSTSGENAVKGQVKASMVQEVFGLKPYFGWFIGDTETDIMAGKLLGLHTAAVTFGIRTAEQLRPHSPDILIDCPEQLIEWVGSDAMWGAGQGLAGVQ